jgi:hypothetical protein
MVAIDNPGSEMADLMRRVRFLETQSGADGAGFGGGDSSHPGAGSNSVALGPDGAAASGTNAVALGRSADASGYDAVALGRTSKAYGGDYSTAVGAFSWADEDSSSAFGGAASAQAVDSTALGFNTLVAFAHTHSTAVGADAETTGANQVRVGTTADTVSVPGNLTVAGTFSNPSARRLKQNIIPAPCLRSIFPTLFEWEYIEGDGRRQIGPMADDLVGTDAERFLVRDAEGEPAGIDKLGLHTAQIAALLARIELLEDELRRRDG